MVTRPGGTDDSAAGGIAAGLAAVAPLVVAIVALAAFVPTIMPGVGFWDTAEFQAVLPVMGTAHPTGFPTYVILGWAANLVLTPLGEPAFRMNVLSALIVATAAGVTVVLVRRLTGSTALGAAAGLGLATTPIAWGIATHADPHALHLLLVAVLFVLLVRWEQARTAGTARADRWLIGAAAVFGLAVGNHSLTLLLAAPVGLYVLAVDPRILMRPRLVAQCVVVLAGVIGLVYLQLPVRAGLLPAPLVYGRPDTWDGFVYVVLAEQFRGSIVDPFGGLDRKAAALVELTARQFGALAILVPLGFLATLARHPRYALLSGTALAITVFFSASYVNAAIERYYLGPALIAWTWLAVLAGVIAAQVAPWSWDERRDAAGETGAAGDEAAPGDLEGDEAAPGHAEAEDPRASDRPAARRPVAATVALVVAAAALLVPTAGSLQARAIAVDRSDDPGSGPWLDATLAVLEPDAVVVSWWSYSTALWYAQHVDGRRPDIWIVDDRTRLDEQLGEVSDVIDAQLGRRPVYLIRVGAADIARLRDRFVIESVGPGLLSNVHRVVARVEGEG